MVRQYRIDRFNGMEILVCEVYRKHTWSQSEFEAWQAWKLDHKDVPDSRSQSEFRLDLDDFLCEHSEDGSRFYGLSFPIPVYDHFPAIVLRGAVVDNRIVSLQVDYNSAVLSPEIYDAVVKFYGVVESRHWRDMVAHQIERYGTLFESEDY